MPGIRYYKEAGIYKSPGRRGITSAPPVDNTRSTPFQSFDMLTFAAEYAIPDKLVAGHYFCTYPPGGDGRSNTGTWWPTRMPGGTDSPTYGGEFRDRPWDAHTRPRADGAVPWYVLDRADEINWARDAGLTAFTIDWLNLNDGTGDNRTGQVRELCDALVHLGYTDFKLILMPDGTTSISNDTNYAAFVAKTLDLINDYPDVWYRGSDGKLVIFPYYPEAAPRVSSVNNSSQAAGRTYWANYRTDIEAGLGESINLPMCYVRAWSTDVTAAPGLSAYGDSNSRWGDRDYSSSGSSSVNNRGAAAHSLTTYGKTWIHPVSVQDNRVNSRESPKYWEAGNTRNFIASWAAAIDAPNCVGVQIPTFNDYREHAHIAKSPNHGYCWLDISAYYSYRFRTGEWPTIERDCIYLSHRLHRNTGYAVTGTQTQFMVRTGTAAALDDVEAYVHLTSIVNTQVGITVNGVETLFTPGVGTKTYGGDGVYSFRVGLPLNGTLSARIVRNGNTVQDITSPYPVTNTPVAQDMHYRMVSSLRGPV